MSELPQGVVGIDHQGMVTIITIRNPPVNVISRTVIAALHAALAEATAMGCRALILTGAGDRFFAAGADVTEFEGTSGDVANAGQDLTHAIEAMPCPVIAAINGSALGGGCELTLACDLRVCAATARLGQPEINLGIIPGWGGTQRLPQLIGRGRAMEMLLSGEPVDAAKALAMGLVNAVVDPGELRPAVNALAEKLALKAPRAVAATKRAVLGGAGLAIGEGLRVERREFAGVLATEDAREGVRAFLEKRHPSFAGR